LRLKRPGVDGGRLGDTRLDLTDASDLSCFNNKYKY